MSKAELKSWEITQTKRVVYIRQGGRCFVCGEHMTQLAHILPQDALHREIYGDEVIHHPKNIIGVCSLKCNAKVQINRRSRPVAAERQAARVRLEIKKERRMQKWN